MKTLPEGTIYDIIIQAPGVSIASLALCEADAKALVEKTASEHKGNTELLLAIDKCKSSFGFVGYGRGAYSVTISAKMPRVNTGEMHRCPERGASPVHYNNAVALLDEWVLRGNDKCCSYCGSLHPDRVLELLRQKGFGIIDRSDKVYKWYINQEDVPNACFGGIKYYRWHDTPEFIAGYNDLQRPLGGLVDTIASVVVPL